MNYVRNEHSDPESALMLTLILFFGLTREDLIHAQISMPIETSLKLILRRKTKAVGQENYNREQMLELPNAPVWLSQPQKRYSEVWQQRYAEIPK